MRILQLHTRYREPGGEDAVASAEADLLRSVGHEVVRHEAINPGGPLRAAGALALAPWNPAAAFRVGQLAARIRPDVAHVHNTWFTLSPSVITSLSRRGIPVVLTLHNYRLLCANAQLFRAGRPCEDCVGSTSLHGIRHRCYRGSTLASTAAALTIASNRSLNTWSRGVDRFVALTSFARSLFVAGGLPGERISVRRNCTVDPGLRRSAPSESQEILFVGRLSPEKGLDVALDAWAMGPPPGMRLVVVGDGPMRQELASRRLPEVEFVGQLPKKEVTQRLLRARALVFPSVWYEAQGMVLLEAMAAGAAVLASDLGGTAEVLGTSGQRPLVRPGDPRAWAQAMMGLLDPLAVDQAGRAGRERFLAAFTPELGLATLVRVYEEAITHREGKGPYRQGADRP